MGESYREPSFLFMSMLVKYRFCVSSEDNILGNQYTFINTLSLPYICDCILNQQNEANN
jgi:hypothetical protein